MDLQKLDPPSGTLVRRKGEPGNCPRGLRRSRGPAASLQQRRAPTPLFRSNVSSPLAVEVGTTSRRRDCRWRKKNTRTPCRARAADSTKDARAGFDGPTGSRTCSPSYLGPRQQRLEGRFSSLPRIPTWAGSGGRRRQDWDSGCTAHVQRGACSALRGTSGLWPSTNDLDAAETPPEREWLAIVSQSAAPDLSRLRWSAPPCSWRRRR